MSIRSSLIVLAEPEWTGGHEPGRCMWCGLMIELVDPSDHRRARRCYHRGDAHERGDRNCLGEMRGSRCWSARDALLWVARHKHDGRAWCAACGLVVAQMTAGRPGGECAEPWEADHIVPLEDGGAHELANFQALCTPCHVAKTAAEASARAERRRGRQRLGEAA